MRALKVLIVDSDVISRRVLENLLDGLGHSVRIESDLSVLKQPLEVDLVFIDPGPVEYHGQVPHLEVPVVMLLTSTAQPRLYSLNKPYRKEELVVILEAIARTL
jgi:hypothetical protein